VILEDRENIVNNEKLEENIYQKENIGLGEDKERNIKNLSFKVFLSDFLS